MRRKAVQTKNTKKSGKTFQFFYTPEFGQSHFLSLLALNHSLMSKKRKNDRPGHWRYKYEKKGLTLSTLNEKIKKAVAGYLSAYLQKSVFQHSLLPDL